MLEKIITAILLCLGCLLAVAESESRHFQIHYVVDIAEVDSSFMDNEYQIQKLHNYLYRIRTDKTLTLDSVKFTGTASPDGYFEFNNWLSENRLENLKKIIRKDIDLPDSIVFRNDAYITWKMFRDSVAASEVPMRDSVLAILDMEPGLVPWYKIESTRKRMNTDHRMLKIRALNRGRVYESLKPILHNLRFADVELVVSRNKPMVKVPTLPVDFGELDLYIIPVPYYNDRAYYYIEDEWVRRLYIKNNLVKDALLLANLSVEVDLARHWTFDLTMFYSKWDYFKSQIKFRMAGFQTELRYWFNPVENDGWFIGGHFGYSYYNMAFNGAHRYQDLYGKTPTKGGGVSVGWRKQFGYKNRWRFELAAGVGVYPLHYSIFQNTPDVKDGWWIQERRETFVGVDVFSVSIGYAIDMYKKKTIRKGVASQ